MNGWEAFSVILRWIICSDVFLWWRTEDASSVYCILLWSYGVVIWAGILCLYCFDSRIVVALFSVHFLLETGRLCFSMMWYFTTWLYISRAYVKLTECYSESVDTLNGESRYIMAHSRLLFWSLWVSSWLIKLFSLWQCLVLSWAGSTMKLALLLETQLGFC